MINLWSVWVVRVDQMVRVIQVMSGATFIYNTNISLWLVDKARKWLDMGPMKVGSLTDSLMLLRVGWCDWMIKRQTQFLVTMLDDVADAWWLDGLICEFFAATMLFSLKSKRSYELTIYIFVDLAEAVNHRVCCAFGNVSFTIDADNVHIKLKRSTFWKL